MSAKQIFVSWRYIISEMHLRQSRFTFSIWGPFSTNKERIQNFKEIGDSRHISKPNQILSICYSDGFENLSRRATPDKLLCDKAFSIAKKPNYNGYRHGLTSRVYKFFEEKSIAMGEIKHLVFLLMQGQKLTN